MVSSGIAAVSFDGQNYEELKHQSLQKRCPFTDLRFKAHNDSSVGFSDKRVPKGLRWKRPKDLCNSPKFISEEFTLTDLNPGKMGHCWFVAAAACLTLHPRLLRRVVPQDQNFDDDVGIFHFQFWKFGQWVDVVVDDWLPTLHGKLLFAKPTENGEFWLPLLEKAYAKLNGSYKAIYSGVTRNAFVDLTGGIGETIFLKQESVDRDLDVSTTIQTALGKNSLIGAGIWVSKNRRHAYSIMGVHKLTVEGKEETILRLRNPWGEREWDEDWSDKSAWWLKVKPEDQKFLLQKEDREFWMTLEDFIERFEVLHICHLSADAPEEEGAGFCWNSSSFHGRWVKSQTGDGGKSSDALWMNPQFHVSLAEPDEDGSTCTVLVSLMQRNQRESGKKFLKIGITVYKVTEEDLKLKDPAQRKELVSNLEAERTTIYRDKEDITERFKLTPGDYLIVPSTASPPEEEEKEEEEEEEEKEEEADFILRIFTDKRHQSSDFRLQAQKTASQDLSKFIESTLLSDDHLASASKPPKKESPPPPKEACPEGTCSTGNCLNHPEVLPNVEPKTLLI